MEIEAISLILITLMVLTMMMTLIILTVFAIIYLARIDESNDDISNRLSDISRQITEVKRDTEGIRINTGKCCTSDPIATNRSDSNPGTSSRVDISACFE